MPTIVQNKMHKAMNFNRYRISQYTNTKHKPQFLSTAAARESAISPKWGFHVLWRKRVCKLKNYICTGIPALTLKHNIIWHMLPGASFNIGGDLSLWEWISHVTREMTDTYHTLSNTGRFRLGRTTAMVRERREYSNHLSITKINAWSGLYVVCGPVQGRQ